MPKLLELSHQEESLVVAVTEETRRTGVPEVDDTLAISSEDCVGEWIRITNELVADICDRMLSRYGYARWFREEPDPRDLMRSFTTT